MKFELVYGENLPALKDAIDTLLEGAAAVSSVNIFKQDAFYVAAVTYTES